jgi:hypothetical protein
MHYRVRFTVTTPAAPVQAEGDVGGRPFYFRARHDEWSFAVAERAGVDPATVGPEAEAAGDGYYVEGRRGQPWEHRTSFLAAEQVGELIRRCVRRYAKARGWEP